MVYVIASIRVKTGMRSEFLEIFKDNVPNVRQEIGCIKYSPAVDINAELSQQVLDPNVVTVIEEWSSMMALRDHLASPHMYT